MSIGMPVQKAKDRYGKDFESLMDFYLTNGLVYSDNRVFVMAMMHNKNELLKKSKIGLDKLDCWYVHYAAGDLYRLFEIAPYEMEWAIFEREDKPLKCYNIKRMRRLIDGQK